MDNLNEKPLDPAQRRARSRIMKRLASKISRKRKIAMKKKASPEKLKVKAQKAAKEIIRSKILKDKNYKDLGISQKMAVDKQVEKKKAAAKKIAKKLLPKIKKQEIERLKKMQSKKEEKVNEVEQPTPDAAYNFKDIHAIEIYEVQDSDKDIKESTDFEKTNTLTPDEYDEVQNFQNFNKRDWRWLPKQGKYVRKKKV